jgi:hypothetical protein
MHEMVRSYWMHFNLPLEGQVDYMYLDWKGWVSTGVGNKIDETRAEMSPPSPGERASSLALANQINWHDSANAPATPDQVAADWDAVKARLDLAASGHTAFEGIAKLRVSDEEISGLVFAKLDQMEQVLTSRPEFTAFANWPASAQLATLSMCWGMGPMFRFPNFQANVATGNWAGAAEECHFTPDEGTIRIRNKLDRMHFLNAAGSASQDLPAELLTASLGEVLGVQHALYMLGYNPGAQDGADGPKTREAVSAFQANSEIPENGAWNDTVTQATLADTLRTIGWTVV